MEKDLSLKTTHIGSFPFEEPEEPITLTFEHVDIPAWPQLSKRKQESMIIQFNEKLPGFDAEKGIIDTSSPKFEEEMLKFYEDYLQIVEEKNLEPLNTYAISSEYAKGFHRFLEIAKEKDLDVVKGQVTGPFTLAIAFKIETGENPIFREDLRDLIVKFVTIKALYQAEALKKVGKRVIIFLDEPGLSGFGSSAFITISKDDVLVMLNEIFQILKDFGVIPGIHVCANTSWDIVLDSEVEILNFDSFSYFDKFAIYADNIKKFISKENTYIAWGVVPTDSENLEATNLEKVLEKFNEQFTQLANALKSEKEELLKSSMFTPACGLGSLKKEQAKKALEILKAFKEKIA